MIENNYQPHNYYFCSSFYIDTDATWYKCPNCGLIPKKWVFDNGSGTGCGCGNTNYDHFSIFSESIRSVMKRCNGSAQEYNNDNLRKNWNHWVSTGDILFKHASLRDDGRY